MQVTMMNSYKDNQEFRYKLDRLKESVDPRYLVESLGFNVVRETAKELRGTCAIHGGDNKTAFRFNKVTRSWICFSHRCHEIWGSDIIGLIKAAMDTDFISAVKYLESLVGDISDSNYIEYKRKKEREEFIRSKRNNHPRSNIVTEEHLKRFRPFRSRYFLDKGFSKETLDFFEIGGGYTDGKGYIRDVIPIRNNEGFLVGYGMRDIRDFTDYDNKYIHSLNFDKDSVLYNLHNAKHHVKDKPLIIVEGYKSVWRLWEYGIRNVVAVMGSTLCPGQVNLLYMYAINNIVIMFDNDGPGVEGCLKACEELKSKLNIIPVFITDVDENGKGLDPSDLSKDVVYNYLESFI